ncbi:MAG: DUF2207 domain-containing protein [Campylobacterota bacterium]|nr:DUF2207 domain-containing protein [Campylobacterota bacterium]
MLEEVFWDQWYWWWLLSVLFYYSAVLEKSVGIQNLISVPIRYAPAEGVGVLLSGLVYDTFTEHRDFIAAILELKVLGFIEINKKTNGDILLLPTEKERINITPQVEYLLNKILFVGNRESYLIPKKLYVRYNQNESQPTQRYREILEDYHKVNLKASQWVVSEGYMDINPKKERSVFVSISSLLVAILLVLSYFSGMVSDFFAYIAFFFIYFPLFFVVYSKSLVGKVFAGIFPTIIIWLIVSNDELRAVLFEELHLWLYIVVLVAQGAFIFTYEFVGTLTPKGKKIRNHLQGFKHFLKRVKKDEVQRAKKENPEYIDPTLPYMVLFGIEKYELNLDDMKHLAR